MPDAPTLSVYERLLAILEGLPAIGKNQKNTQQGFMFRGHDDILNALNPLLAQHGVFVVPDVMERVTAQRTTAKGSVMYEVNLHVRFRFYGAGGDWIEASTWGEGTDTGDKATNKAMTMAFKNVLNQTFAISSAEFKDADADTPEATTGRNSSERPQEAFRAPATTAAEEAPMEPGQKREIKGLLEALEKEMPSDLRQRDWTTDAAEWSREQFSLPAGVELNKAQAQRLIMELEQWLVEEQAARAGAKA